MLLIETSMCFSFFGGDPFNTHKKKGECLKKTNVCQYQRPGPLVNLKVLKVAKNLPCDTKH